MYSCRTGIFLSQKVNKHGYAEVNLWRNNTGTTRAVHRLVAEAFMPNPNYYPQVNHKDENKLNNNADNLEWCTAKYNSNYGTGNRRGVEGRQKNHRNCKAVQNADTGRVYLSITEAAADVNTNRMNIGRVCNGQRKTAGGYRWVWWQG